MNIEKLHSVVPLRLIGQLILYTVSEVVPMKPTGLPANITYIKTEEK